MTPSAMETPGPHSLKGEHDLDGEERTTKCSHNRGISVVSLPWGDLEEGMEGASSTFELELGRQQMRP